MQREIQFKPGRHFIARFLPGKDLQISIVEFCKKHKIKAGYIPLLQGGLKYADIINPNSVKIGENKKVYPVKKRYNYAMEFVAQGTIALNKKGEYENHIHIVGGGNKHKMLCMGHLVKGEIAILTEIVIIETDGIELIRAIDKGIFDKPLLFFKER